jgi:hypothetical protein
LTIERRAGIMRLVAKQAVAHVTLSGDRSGEYLIAEEDPDGRLVLVPVISAQAILDSLGHTRATLADLEAEYGPMLPPDGEG